VKSEANKPSHITRGDVLDDLGFPRSEASALRVKATLVDAILREISERGYTQAQLVEILDEYQPSVSNLLRGKIAGISLEKLLTYSDRLKLTTILRVHSESPTPRSKPTSKAADKSVRPTRAGARHSARNRNGSRGIRSQVAAG